MVSYVGGALAKDEQIVHIGHVSLWSLWHLILLGVVLLPAHLFSNKFYSALRN